MVYADILRPASKWRATLYDMTSIIGGSLFIALCAHLAIHLPLSPVPVTGQTFAVLCVAMLLGSRWGMLAVAIYLVEGALGLPVFANGGAGVLHLLGPTGGYLIGFVVAAFITGRLAERGWDRRPHTTALAMFLGNLAIYAGGIPWLAMYLGPERALTLGLWPFLAGDLLKIMAATALLPSVWRFMAILQGR